MLQQIQKFRTVHAAIEFIVTRPSTGTGLDAFSGLLSHECPKLLVCDLNLLHADFHATRRRFLHPDAHELLDKLVVLLVVEDVCLV